MEPLFQLSLHGIITVYSRFPKSVCHLSIWRRILRSRHLRELQKSGAGSLHYTSNQRLWAVASIMHQGFHLIGQRRRNLGKPRILLSGNKERRKAWRLAAWSWKMFRSITWWRSDPGKDVRTLGSIVFMRSTLVHINRQTAVELTLYNSSVMYMLSIPKFGCYFSQAFAQNLFYKFGIPVFNTCFLYSISMANPWWRMGCQGNAYPLPALSPNSFIFIQFGANILQNNRLVYPLWK